MGRPPCCDKSNVKRGLWTAEEDAKILAYVATHGIGNWTLVPKKAGLNRCGKSCRLRWTNYLRPDLNHNSFTPQEEDLILRLHRAIGSRWSLIAKQLPGRTDNDVKNYWNTKLRKKLAKMEIDPITHKPFSQVISDLGNISNPAAAISARPPPPASESEEHSSSRAAAASSPPFPRSRFIRNQESIRRRFTNDVVSSSSSSSSIVKELRGPSQPISASEPSPVQVHSLSPSPCPSGWSDFISGDSSIQLRNETLQSDFASGSEFGTRNEVLGGGASSDRETGEKNLQSESAASASASICTSSSASSLMMSSFVKAILDWDSKMQMEFPGVFMDE